jgi:diguanylate cyclase (GGDEF)-like protein/PAS domain S-box-containing protein
MTPCLAPVQRREENAAETEAQLRDEIARLRKTVDVLMNRVEGNAGQELDHFGLFQATLVLEDLVQRRTEELQTALKQNERITRTLRDSEARFRGLAEQSLAGIAIVDATRFIYANARLAENLGYEREELLTVAPLSIVAHSARLRVTQHLSDCLAHRPHPQWLEFEAIRRDGRPVFIELAASRMRMEGEYVLICVATDITARKVAERKVQALNRRLAEMAVRDPLTGLYNRRFMEASLEREILEADRNGAPLSLVVCDLDHFKAINDTFGHQTGDQVLKAVGSLLKRRCRRSDIACRYGGEEFLVVFPGMPAEVAATWAEKIRTAISEVHVKRDSSSRQVTASFGVATYPQDGPTWHALIAAADEAQHAAKAAGRNLVKSAPPKNDLATVDAPALAARAM